MKSSVDKVLLYLHGWLMLCILSVRKQNQENNGEREGENVMFQIQGIKKGYICSER